MIIGDGADKIAVNDIEHTLYYLSLKQKQDPIMLLSDYLLCIDYDRKFGIRSAYIHQRFQKGEYYSEVLPYAREHEEKYGDADSRYAVIFASFCLSAPAAAFHR